MPIFKTFAIFAKFWEKGKVKTRLANSIGDSQAANLYFRFLSVSMQNASELAVRKLMCFSPAERENEFRELAPDWELVAQITSDLGSRMRFLFDQQFAPQTGSDLPQHVEENSDRRLVLIGSDTPLLSRNVIDQAFEELGNHDVVIGPSQDGGYYLIGASNRTPAIFDEINWSSDQVFKQTVERLEQQGYRYFKLDVHRDVDDVDDLQWMVDQLKQQASLSRDKQLLLQQAQSALCNRKQQEPSPGNSPAADATVEPNIRETS